MGQLPRSGTKTVSNLEQFMEAGGVEPPSEKRNATEPTCLSQFSLVRLPRSERARNAAG
jgi:hypothetical protein